MSTDKETLLRELAQVDAAIEALVSRLTPPDLKRPIYSDWTLLQVLAHLASFDYVRLARRWLRQAQENIAPPAATFDAEAWNQREVAVRQGRALDEILAELRAHRQATRDFVAALSQADLDIEVITATGTKDSIGNILWQMATEHEKQHLAHISQALGSG